MYRMRKLGPIIISLEGKQLTPEEQQILMHKNIGGLILFSRNFANKHQIIQLIQSVRKINPHIIIMVDHEGGRVWRFKNDEFPNPGPMNQLGELYLNNPKLALETAFNYGKQIATSLLECDIDLNLAPDLDLNHNNISSVIGDRAIHSDPQIIALLAAQFIKGQQASGMQAVGKHFPGHGAIAADTHTEIAIDARDRQTIFNQDLHVFELLIAKNQLPALMPAHVIYTDLDPKPAGFSKIWLQDILRKKLNFNGAIISDCLSMKAAQQFISHETDPQIINLHLAQQALQAGCDLVIFNGLQGINLLHLLDNLSWNCSKKQVTRINSLKANYNQVINQCCIKV